MRGFKEHCAALAVFIGVIQLRAKAGPPYNLGDRSFRKASVPRMGANGNLVFAVAATLAEAGETVKDAVH
jgi:hypothetical protein